MSDITDSTQEVWKTITEFPAYSVSNLGRIRRDVKSLRKQPGIIKPIKRGRPNKEYCYVELYRDNKPFRKLVHRVVVECFIGPAASRLLQVNHKNGDRNDNNLNNLEWVSASENIQHSYRVLLRRRAYGERNGSSKLKEADVRAVRAMLDRMESNVDIARKLNISPSSISAIKTGKLWVGVS